MLKPLRLVSISALAALALSTLTALPASARVDVWIATPPPAPVIEVVPGPRRGLVWAPGVWVWRHGHHVWVRGHWVRERPGHQWIADRWDRDGDRYIFVPGHWERL